MYYEINVSLNGSHFFATHERSINCKDQLKRVYAALAETFTKEKGYEISVTEYPARCGERINMNLPSWSGK